MIDNTSQLNEHQLKEVENLLKLCKKADGSTPNIYPHILTQHRSFPANLLCYEQQQLIAFLSVYFFYDEAVEVALIVNPCNRRKGVAKQLIQTIIPLVEYHNYQNLIFTSPSHLNDQWLLSKGFAYLHSEYYMERDDLNPILDTNQNLKFREATLNDIPVLCAIDEVCFPANQSQSIERFQYLIDGREYQLILALKNNQPIGKAHIRWQKDGATLSDIAILPAYQGKGLGTSLIAHCINLALSEGKPHLNLDVETHNLRALNLYTQLGFFIQNASDYWTISLNQLRKNKFI